MQDKHTTKSERALQEAVKHIGLGATIVTGGTLGGIALEYISQALLGRFLGPEDYGLLAMGHTILIMLSLFSMFGLADAVTRFISMYRQCGDLPRAKGTIVAALRIGTVLSVVVTVLLFVLADDISLLFSKPGLTPVIRCFSLALMARTLGSISAGVLMGLKRVKQWMILRRVADKLARVISLLCFLVTAMKLTLVGASVSYVVGLFVMAAIGLFWVWRGLSDMRLVRPIINSREVLIYAWPLLFSSLVREVDRQAEVLVAGAFLSARDVGLYSSALLLAQLMRIIVMSARQVFLPLATEFQAQGLGQETTRLYRSVSRWLFYVELPIALTLFLFPQDVLSLVYGQEFIEGAVVMRILAVGFLSEAVAGPWRQILLAEAYTKLEAALTALWLVLTLVLDFLWIPSSGISGAAWATVVALVVYHLVGVAVVFSHWRMQPISRNHLGSLMCSGLFFGMWFACVRLAVNLGAIVVLVGASVMTVASCLSVILFIPSRDDRILLALVRRRLRRVGLA